MKQDSQQSAPEIQMIRENDPSPNESEQVLQMEADDDHDLDIQGKDTKNIDELNIPVMSHAALFGATRDQTGGNQCSLLQGDFTGQMGTARERSLEKREQPEEVPDRIVVQSPTGASAQQTLIFDLRNVRENEAEVPPGEPAEQTRCTCPRNNCSKAYCKCFFSGMSCDPRRCSCQGCTNHEEADGFHDTLRRRNEFRETRRGANAQSGSTCNCSRTNCSKRYCPCFRTGQGCHAHCNCQNCANKFNQ